MTIREQWLVVEKIALFLALLLGAVLTLLTLFRLDRLY